MRARFDSVDHDAGPASLIQLTQELDQGRLSGAILADQRDHGAGPELDLDVFEHELLRAGTRTTPSRSAPPK